MQTLKYVYKTDFALFHIVQIDKDNYTLLINNTQVDDVVDDPQILADNLLQGSYDELITYPHEYDYDEDDQLPTDLSEWKEIL